MATFPPKNGIPLEPGITYETIFTAYDANGMPRATPIGVWLASDGPAGDTRLEASIFTTAGIYACLARNREVAINFPSTNQVSYFLLAFKDVETELISRFKAAVEFIPCSAINAPRIDGFGRYIEARVLDRRIVDVNDEISRETGRTWKKCIFTLQAVGGAWEKQDALPVSRLHGIFIEFLVLASKFQAIDRGTRLHVEMKKKAWDLLERLERVGHDHDLVSVAKQLATALSLVREGKPVDLS